MKSNVCKIEKGTRVSSASKETAQKSLLLKSLYKETENEN